MPEDSTPPRRTVTAGGTPNKNPTERMKLPPTTGGGNLRVEAFKGLLGIPMLGLTFRAAVDQVRQPEAISPYSLDVMAISMYADPLAHAVVGMAEQYPVIGTLLDRIGTVTPVMELATVGLALFTQIAENHGKLPAGMGKTNPNLIPREELAKQIREEAAARSNGDG